MSPDDPLERATGAIVSRTNERFERYRRRTLASTDRLFAGLFVGQWLFAIFIALVLSPYGWEGKERAVHMHVWIAIFLGGALASLPIALALKQPGQALTRHVIAVAQMLFSALLIHLSGGRIETHFHVFGSLAILAFYLDWTVLITAALAVAVEHFVRGMLWPESIYGIVNPEWWRFLEHAFWVVFAVAFLIVSCRRHLREWLAAAEEGGMIEAMARAEWHTSSEASHEAPRKTGTE